MGCILQVYNLKHYLGSLNNLEPVGDKLINLVARNNHKSTVVNKLGLLVIGYYVIKPFYGLLCLRLLATWA